MPARGEVWNVDPEPVRGHEQGRSRPALVFSNDEFNNGAAGLVIVIPLTTKEKARMPLRVRIDPPEGGLRQTSFAICESVRSVSVDRLSGAAWGPPVSARTLAAVAFRVRALLDI